MTFNFSLLTSTLPAPRTSCYPQMKRFLTQNRKVIGSNQVQNNVHKIALFEPRKGAMINLRFSTMSMLSWGSCRDARLRGTQRKLRSSFGFSPQLATLCSPLRAACFSLLEGKLQTQKYGNNTRSHQARRSLSQPHR